MLLHGVILILLNHYKVLLILKEFYFQKDYYDQDDLHRGLLMKLINLLNLIYSLLEFLKLLHFKDSNKHFKGHQLHASMYDKDYLDKKIIV